MLIGSEKLSREQHCASALAEPWQSACELVLLWHAASPHASLAQIWGARFGGVCFVQLVELLDVILTSHLQP
jgi:hypothetical protein